MASTPRSTLDDSYILGVTCAICGADALSVSHVARLPDYVSCRACNSAFLVEEGGDRVFYGQIAPGYEETERFALKQWAWIEAVETRAREERPRPDGEETEFPDPETIEETLSPESEADSLSAEDWISSEIPAESMQAAQEKAPISPAAEAPDEEIAEPGWGAAGAPSGYSYTPLEADEEPEQAPALEAEDEGLADFFEALTDDTGEVRPIVEPDAFLQDEEGPDLEAFDTDLERLLQTEDDSGPDLPPPPWASGSAGRPGSAGAGAEEAQAEAAEAPSGAGSTWESFFEAEDALEDEGVPVVDAKDETYESVPGWQRLEDATPLSEEQPVAESTPRASDAEDDETDYSESWGAPEVPEPALGADASPETPDWALPADDEEASKFTGPDELSWGTEPVPPQKPGWQEIPGMFSDEGEAEDSDFLSDLRRSAAIPLESQPVEDQPLLDDEDQGWDMGSEDFSARMESISRPVEEPEHVAAGWEMTAAASVKPMPEPEPEPIPSPVSILDAEEGYLPPPTDPPYGQRYRVVIRGEKVIFPRGECAHCGQTPERGKLAVAGTLPEGQGMGQRKATRFEIPLCGDCRKRAAAKSEDAQAAQLQAHLISAIVGMVFVVGALALDLIDPRNLGIVDLFLGLILLIVGYGGPAYFLLNRIGSYLPPVDARYVRTTLLVPSETQGLETAFEWRNSEYAQRFHNANSASVLGNVTGVKDRIA